MKSVVYVCVDLYCVCVITSRPTQAAAAEEYAVGGQQLKRMQSGSSLAAEEDAVREQKLKWTQSGRSSV